LVFVFFTTCKKIYKHLYIKNIKNTSRNSKKLPECHCIGKIMKYPWISPKFTKMPLAARVAHARLLLAAGTFSGALSGQKMVDPGRSDVKDSYGGGLDCRWWLMSENRRLEASVAADESRPVSGQIERRKRWNRPGFCFIWGRRPFCGGCQACSGRIWEIGGERGSRRREERDALGYAMVRTQTRYTSASEACDPLDLWWKDRAAGIGPICRLIGRSGWAEMGSGATRCTEISVHPVTWRNGIKAQIFSRAEMCWVFNLVW